MCDIRERPFLMTEYKLQLQGCKRIQISIGTLSVAQKHFAVNVSGYKEKDDPGQVSDDEGGA